MKQVRAGLAALVLVWGVIGTDAKTVTANMHVQAAVISSCSVVGNTLDFGEVNLAGSGGPRTQTNIQVTCTQGLPFQVGINNGSHQSSGQRRMVDLTKHLDFLDYEIFKSLTGNDRFGDSVVSQRVNGTGNGQQMIIPAYGEILRGQREPVGNYADDTVITVYF